MTTVKAYLAWCARQVGTQEQPRGSNLQPYAALAGHPNALPWCATFLVAGARETGLRLPWRADTASCATNESAFKAADRLYTKPRVGDWLFVYFPSLGRAAHTGVVWKVDGRYVHTIEANSNNVGAREGYEVCRRRRLDHRGIGAVGIRSFGRPYYTATSLKTPVKPAPRVVTSVPEDDMQARFVLPDDHRRGDALILVGPGGASLVANPRHRQLLIGLGVPERPEEWDRGDYDQLRAVAEGGLSRPAQARLVDELRHAVAPTVKPL